MTSPVPHLSLSPKLPPANPHSVRRPEEFFHKCILITSFPICVPGGRTRPGRWKVLNGSRNEEEGQVTQRKGAPLSRESMSPVGHDGIRGVRVCNPSTQHGPWQRRHTDTTNGLKRITAGEPHTQKMGALDRWRSPRPRAGQSG